MQSMVSFVFSFAVVGMGLNEEEKAERCCRARDFSSLR